MTLLRRGIARCWDEQQVVDKCEANSGGLSDVPFTAQQLTNEPQHDKISWVQLPLPSVVLINILCV